MDLYNLKEFSRLSEKECIEIQNDLKKKVFQQDIISLNDITTVGGVDLAYWQKDSMEYAVCCIVVIDLENNTIIEKKHSSGIVEFPYIPSCLAFRELPLIVETHSKLSVHPDVFMFDGNGILHTRRMGLATHASFYINCPTLGVAKKYFKVSDEKFVSPPNVAGSFSDIIHNGEVIGRAVRTHKDVRPVFISVGNYMDINTVTELVLELTGKESHIPLPTRYADIETHIMRKQLQGSPQIK
ncbi:MAG: endonuclease V [Lachnospiraceae bacterium]|jgi:deoxyribonuclease V|uniref:endonuclease V n=1 Tax=Acutalibacter muris TaxID=1796620 RepID=UPI00272DD33F|nr:endonuclease V [Acutalibacter muris]MCI9104543.1 endonuclease V [Lachnospiraceae bacterium]